VQKQIADHMDRCLEDCDVPVFRKIWAHNFSHLPAPTTDMDCLISIHIARTQTKRLKKSLRFYSHRWLTDQGLPSQLPDNLKPAAEQERPRAVQAVGISLNTTNEILKPVINIIRGSMEDAVMECAAEGELGDTKLVSDRMLEARIKTTKQIVGIIVDKYKPGMK